MSERESEAKTTTWKVLRILNKWCVECKQDNFDQCQDDCGVHEMRVALQQKETEAIKKINMNLEEWKDYFYWHFIFPKLDYTTKNFNKIKTESGTLFIRKEAKKCGREVKP